MHICRLDAPIESVEAQNCPRANGRDGPSETEWDSIHEMVNAPFVKLMPSPADH